MQLILPFISPDATLDTAGGKGANLARLTRAGFPVPPGFIATTSAYREFVAANGLAGLIRQALEGRAADDAPALDAASDHIRAAFSAGILPASVAAALSGAYAVVGGPVAVRSSATAEDLPDLSFAGQQDTFLNIVGAEAVLTAVVNCWSSLWTARAIGYRLRNHISQTDAAVAVVVQPMVASEVSGVLFTANPLSGLLSETVIDATFGLGEALVSGQVEPDHFEFDTRLGQITERRLGAKQVVTRAQPGGGVATELADAAARQTLADADIRELAALGQRVQAEYGAPQDIEWALADGQLYLLQARAITSLFPVPRVSFDPLILWLSFGAVQGVTGPLTPLGRDVIQHFIAGAGRMFGVTIAFDQSDLFAAAGERLWIKLSDVLRHPLGRRLAPVMLGVVEPSIAQILVPLLADPRLGAGQGRLRLTTVRRMARFLLPVLGSFIHSLLRPEQARAVFDADLEGYLAAARVAPAADRFGRLANTVEFILNQVGPGMPFALPRFIGRLGPGGASLAWLNRFAAQHGQPALALELTRGLPRNVTTEMDLALWQAAQAIRADPQSMALFGELDAPALAERYLAGSLPPAAQTALAGFMERYGMRGLGEIDLGQPRWRDDPAPTLHTLQSYLQIDPASAPDVVFARGQHAAQAALEQLAALARRGPLGWLRERLVRAAARRVWVLMGARESPKFLLVRAMGLARQSLLAVGQEFVAAGTLARPDDLAFLTLAEWQALAAQTPNDWQSLVAVRRAAFEREGRRRQVPRLLASDGRAFYAGLGAVTDSAAALRGSPVSAGVVEGVVHVVLDPRAAQLAPGEILVCPGTDPAWTPLFLVAGGLITEVGGMMTHGSVVAREYGIPAVVGVDRATQRLKTGQRIRLDGTTGAIVLLE